MDSNALVELDKFISAAVVGVENGINLEERYLTDPIEIEISISKTLTRDGGVKIYVAKGGASSTESSVAKIRIKVHPKDSKKLKRDLTGQDMQKSDNSWEI